MKAVAGHSVVRALGALGLVAMLVVGFPWALMGVARARFDGPAPWTGVAPPNTWTWSKAQDALTDRLSEGTIADVVIRASLAVVWVAVGVLAVTVIAELVHQIRHDGIGLPSVRGLGWGQPLARYIATGLLVVTPLLGSSRAAAAPSLPVREASVAALVTTPVTGPITSPVTGRATSSFTEPSLVTTSLADGRSRVTPRAAGGREVDSVADYVVVPGDSVYGIAERLAGGDRRSTPIIADRILDLNLGSEMAAGQRFVNAAYIEPGWVLKVPSTGAGPMISAPAPNPTSVDRHTVTRGETLWSIAATRLGDEERWPEIWDSNAGRDMGDGRTFDDPHLIVPGWELTLPPVPYEQPPLVADEAAPSDVDVDDGDAGDVDDGGRDGVDAGDGDGAGDDDAGGGGAADADVGGGDVSAADATVDDAADDAGGGHDEPPTVMPAVSATPAVASTDAPRSTVDAQAANSASTTTTPSTSSTTTTTVAGGALDGGASGSTGGDQAPGAAPVGLGQAVMLSVGLLTLLGVLRSRRLRTARPRARVPEPRPRPAAIERVLRSADAGERLLRLDLALRWAASVIGQRDRQVLAALVDHTGGVELTLTGPCELPAPWAGRANRWTLPGQVPIEVIAPEARSSGAPCIALVQLGVAADGRDLFVDLEALGIVSIDAPADLADGVVAAVAATLGSSVFAEVARLVGVGVPIEAFVSHRHADVCATTEEAVALAGELIGSTGESTDSTFAMRSRMVGGEAWEPAVVLVGSTAGATGTPIEVVPSRGLAVVFAAAVPADARITFAEGVWRFAVARGADGVEPIEFTPVSLSPAVVRAIDELLVDAAAPLVDPELDDASADVGGIDAGDGDADTDSGAAGEEAGDADAGEAGERDESDDTRSDRTGDPVDAGDVVDAVQPVDAAGHHDAPLIVLPPPPDASPGPDALDPPGSADDEYVDAPWSIMVRLLGEVEVMDVGGNVARFEKSKTRELIAWLSTHRERATRSGARTALWDLDVRDETFANVVSAARRTMARLVAPPDGEEWLARTNTARLPLHRAVVTDADLVEARLAAARLQPPHLAVDTLEPAVALIRGMPFEGTSYLWPDAEGLTSHLVLLATSAAAELAAHHLSLGDVEGVFRATGQGLRVLAGHEELIALRMRAHAQAGDHAGVRHEWESYERVVTADPWSDGEPAPKLVDLRRELLAPPT